MAGVVLVGGAGRRMGRTKHRLTVGGRELARIVADVLSSAGCRPVFQVGSVDPSPGIAFVPDRWPGEGPLGGVISALDHLADTAPHVGAAVVAACDLPGLDLDTVAAVATAAAPDRVGAVAAVADGQLVPLVRWRVDRRAELAVAFAGGMRSLRDGLDLLDAAFVEVSASSTADVDTPSDLTEWSASVPDVNIPEIDVDALAELLEAGSVRLIDVREPDEYAAGHVPGAVLIPLDTVPKHLDRFAGDGPTYVICRSGARSHRACEHVAEHAGADVVNVAGGTLAWIESGRPTASGSS